MSLRLALGRAAREGKRNPRTLHVYCERGAFVVSEVRPVLELREAWLRVRVDGMVEHGKTGRVIGSLQELGLR